MRNQMKQIVVLAVAVFMCLSGMSAPFRFDDSAEDIKDFVTIGITNCIRSSTVALVYRQTDGELLMPWGLEYELGLQRWHCSVVLKGDSLLNKVCYLYATPRQANVLPKLYTSMGGYTPGSSKTECYFLGDNISPRNMVMLEGRRKWMYHPPYDPYAFYDIGIMQLMLLTPEHKLDKKRIKEARYEDGIRAIGNEGKNCMALTSEELMAKLKVEKAFSNRVFRMNEGCAFQVDYPMPDMDWRDFGNKKEHLEKLKSIQAGNLVLMHLSADEVSEIVYLSYLVDGGDVKGYEAACARCPKVLKPVAELKTGIGKRLRKAMLEGGMLRMGNGK